MQHLPPVGQAPFKVPRMILHSLTDVQMPDSPKIVVQLLKSLLVLTAFKELKIGRAVRPASPAPTPAIDTPDSSHKLAGRESSMFKKGLSSKSTPP